MKELRSFLKKNFCHILFILFIISINIIVFRKLSQAFFQQDEWFGLGKAIYSKTQGLGYYFKILSGYHFTPLSLFFYFWEFNSFGLNIAHYYLASVILHLITTFLVYVLIFNLTRRKTIGCIAALFFMLNSVSSQAITWIGAGINTLGCALFVLLSLIAFLEYIKSDKRKFYYWSIVLFIISLGFKESSLFLLLFLPLFDYIWREKKDREILPFLKSHLILLILGRKC